MRLIYLADSLLRSIAEENKKYLELLSDPTLPLFTKEAPAYSFIIGGGGTTLASVFALVSLGVSTIFLLNRDESETAAVMKHYPQYNIIHLTSLEQAKAETTKLQQSGHRLRIGVGAIPAIEPVTDAEKMVYTVAKFLFELKDEAKSSDDFKQRHFLEMCYKVRCQRGLSTALRLKYLETSQTGRQ